MSKYAPNGTIFTSVPFGFSTTQSFVWSSRDHGNSYQFVPGNLGPGKPSTCVGGGDTDLYVDSGGRAVLLGPAGPDEHLQQHEHRRRRDLEHQLRRRAQRR